MSNQPYSSPWRSSRYNPPTRGAGAPQSPYNSGTGHGGMNLNAFGTTGANTGANPNPGNTFAANNFPNNNFTRSNSNNNNNNIFTAASPGTMKPANLRSRFSSAFADNDPIPSSPLRTTGLGGMGGATGAFTDSDPQGPLSIPGTNIHTYLKHQMDSELREFDEYITVNFKNELEKCKEDMKKDFKLSMNAMEMKLPEMIDNRVVSAEQRLQNRVLRIDRIEDELAAVGVKARAHERQLKEINDNFSELQVEVRSGDIYNRLDELASAAGERAGMQRVKEDAALLGQDRQIMLDRLAEIERMAEGFSRTCEKVMENKSQMMGLELEELGRRLEDFRSGLEERVGRIEVAEEGMKEGLQQVLNTDDNPNMSSKFRFNVGASQSAAEAGRVEATSPGGRAKLEEHGATTIAIEGTTAIYTSEPTAGDPTSAIQESGTQESAIQNPLITGVPSTLENGNTGKIFVDTTNGGVHTSSKLLNNSLSTLHQHLLSQVDAKLKAQKDDYEFKFAEARRSREETAHLTEERLRDKMKKRADVVDNIIRSLDDKHSSSVKRIEKTVAGQIPSLVEEAFSARAETRLTNLVKREFAKLELPELVQDIIVDRFIVENVPPGEGPEGLRGGNSDARGSGIEGIDDLDQGEQGPSLLRRKKPIANLLVTRAQLNERDENRMEETIALVSNTEKAMQRFCEEQVVLTQNQLEQEHKARLKNLEASLKAEHNFVRKESTKLKKQIAQLMSHKDLGVLGAGIVAGGNGGNGTGDNQDGNNGNNGGNNGPNGGNSPPGSPVSPTRANVLANVMIDVAELKERIAGVPAEVRAIVETEMSECKETIAHESISSIVAKLQESNAENEAMGNLASASSDFLGQQIERGIRDKLDGVKEDLGSELRGELNEVFGLKMEMTAEKVDKAVVGLDDRLEDMAELLETNLLRQVKSKTESVKEDVLESLTDFKTLEPVLSDDRFTNKIVGDLSKLTETQVKAIMGSEMRKEVRKHFTSIHREMDEQMEKVISAQVSNQVKETVTKEVSAGLDENRIVKVVTEALSGVSGVSASATSSAGGSKAAGVNPDVDATDANEAPGSKGGSKEPPINSIEGVYRAAGIVKETDDEDITAFQIDRRSSEEVMSFQTVVREFVARTVLGALTGDGPALTLEGENPMPRFTTILTERLSDLENQLASLKSQVEVYPPRDEEFERDDRERMWSKSSRYGGAGGGGRQEESVMSLPQNPPGGRSLADALATAGSYIQKTRQPVGMGGSVGTGTGIGNNIGNGANDNAAARRGSDPGPFRELLESTFTWRRVQDFNQAKRDRRSFQGEPVWDDLRVENLERELAGLRRGMAAVLAQADVQFNEMDAALSGVDGGDTDGIGGDGGVGVMPGLASGLASMFKVGMKSVEAASEQRRIEVENAYEEDNIPNDNNNPRDNNQDERDQRDTSSSPLPPKGKDRMDRSITPRNIEELQDACLRESEQLMQESLVWFSESMMGPMKAQFEQLRDELDNLRIRAKFSKSSADVQEAFAGPTSRGGNDSMKDAFGLDTAVDSVSFIDDRDVRNDPHGLGEVRRLQGELARDVRGLGGMGTGSRNFSSAMSLGGRNSGTEGAASVTGNMTGVTGVVGAERAPFVTTEDLAMVVSSVETIVDRMDEAFGETKAKTQNDLSEQAANQNNMLIEMQKDVNKLLYALGVPDSKMDIVDGDGTERRSVEVGVIGDRDGVDGVSAGLVSSTAPRGEQIKLVSETLPWARGAENDAKIGQGEKPPRHGYQTAAQLLAARLKRRVQTLMVEKSVVFGLQDSPRQKGQLEKEQRVSRSTRPDREGLPPTPTPSASAGMQDVDTNRTEPRQASAMVGKKNKNKFSFLTGDDVDPIVKEQEEALDARPFVTPGLMFDDSTPHRSPNGANGANGMSGRGRMVTFEGTGMDNSNSGGFQSAAVGVGGSSGSPLGSSMRALSPNSRSAATFEQDIVILMEDLERRVSENAEHQISTLLGRHKIAIRDQLETVLRDKLTSEALTLSSQLSEIEGRVLTTARASDQRVGHMASQLDSQFEELRNDMDYLVGQVRDQATSATKSANRALSLQVSGAGLSEGKAISGVSGVPGTGFASAGVSGVGAGVKTSLADTFRTSLNDDKTNAGLFEQLCKDQSFKLMLNRMDYGEEKTRSLQGSIRRVEEQLATAIQAAEKARVSKIEKKEKRSSSRKSREGRDGSRSPNSPNLSPNERDSRLSENGGGGDYFDQFGDQGFNGNSRPSAAMAYFPEKNDENDDNDENIFQGEGVSGGISGSSSSSSSGDSPSDYSGEDYVAKKEAEQRNSAAQKTAEAIEETLNSPIPDDIDPFLALAKAKESNEKSNIKMEIAKLKSEILNRLDDVSRKVKLETGNELFELKNHQDVKLKEKHEKTLQIMQAQLDLRVAEAERRFQREMDAQNSFRTARSKAEVSQLVADLKEDLNHQIARNTEELSKSLGEKMDVDLNDAVARSSPGSPQEGFGGIGIDGESRPPRSPSKAAQLLLGDRADSAVLRELVAVLGPEVKRSMMYEVRNEMGNQIARSKELKAVPMIVDELRQELKDAQNLELAKLDVKLDSLHDKILPELRRSMDDQLRVAHQLHRQSLQSMQRRHWDQVIKHQRTEAEANAASVLNQNQQNTERRGSLDQFGNADPTYVSRYAQNNDDNNGNAGNGGSNGGEGSSGSESGVGSGSDSNGDGANNGDQGNRSGPPPKLSGAVGGMNQRDHHPVHIRNDLDIAHARLDSKEETIRQLVLDVEGLRSDLLRLTRGGGIGVGVGSSSESTGVGSSLGLLSAGHGTETRVGVGKLNLQMREEIRRIALQAIESRLAPSSSSSRIKSKSLEKEKSEKNKNRSKKSVSVSPDATIVKAVSSAEPENLGPDEDIQIPDLDPPSLDFLGSSPPDIMELRRHLTPLIANDVKHVIGGMQFRSAAPRSRESLSKVTVSQSQKEGVSKATSGAGNLPVENFDGIDGIDGSDLEAPKSLAEAGLVGSNDVWTLGDLREEVYDVAGDVAELVDALKEGGLLNKALIQQAAKALLPKLKEEIDREVTFQTSRPSKGGSRAGPGMLGMSGISGSGRSESIIAELSDHAAEVHLPGGPISPEKLRSVMDDRLHSLWSYISKLEKPMQQLERELNDAENASPSNFKSKNVNDEQVEAAAAVARETVRQELAKMRGTLSGALDDFSQLDALFPDGVKSRESRDKEYDFGNPEKFPLSRMDPMMGYGGNLEVFDDFGYDLEALVGMYTSSSGEEGDETQGAGGGFEGKTEDEGVKGTDGKSKEGEHSKPEGDEEGDIDGEKSPISDRLMDMLAAEKGVQQESNEFPSAIKTKIMSWKGTGSKKNSKNSKNIGGSGPSGPFASSLSNSNMFAPANAASLKNLTDLWKNVSGKLQSLKQGLRQEQRNLVEKSMGKMGRALSESMATVDNLVRAQQESEQNWNRARRQMRSEALNVVTGALQKLGIEDLADQLQLLQEKFLIAEKNKSIEQDRMIAKVKDVLEDEKQEKELADDIEAFLDRLGKTRSKRTAELREQLLNNTEALRNEAVLPVDGMLLGQGLESESVLLSRYVRPVIGAKAPVLRGNGMGNNMGSSRSGMRGQGLEGPPAKDLGDMEVRMTALMAELAKDVEVRIQEVEQNILSGALTSQGGQVQGAQGQFSQQGQQFQNQQAQQQQFEFSPPKRSAPGTAVADTGLASGSLDAMQKRLEQRFNDQESKISERMGHEVNRSQHLIAELAKDVESRICEVRDEVLLSTRRGDQQLLRSCEERVLEQSNQAEQNLQRRLQRGVDSMMHDLKYSLEKEFSERIRDSEKRLATSLKNDVLLEVEVNRGAAGTRFVGGLGGGASGGAINTASGAKSVWKQPPSIDGGDNGSAAGSVAGRTGSVWTQAPIPAQTPAQTQSSAPQAQPSAPLPDTIPQQNNNVNDNSNSAAEKDQRQTISDVTGQNLAAFYSDADVDNQGLSEIGLKQAQDAAKEAAKDAAKEFLHAAETRILGLLSQKADQEKLDDVEKKLMRMLSQSEGIVSEQVGNLETRLSNHISRSGSKVSGGEEEGTVRDSAAEQGVVPAKSVSIMSAAGPDGVDVTDEISLLKSQIENLRISMEQRKKEIKDVKDIASAPVSPVSASSQLAPSGLSSGPGSQKDLRLSVALGTIETLKENITQIKDEIESTVGKKVRDAELRLAKTSRDQVDTLEERLHLVLQEVSSRNARGSLLETESVLRASNGGNYPLGPSLGGGARSTSHQSAPAGSIGAGDMSIVQHSIDSQGRKVRELETLLMEKIDARDYEEGLEKTERKVSKNLEGGFRRKLDSAQEELKEFAEERAKKSVEDITKRVKELEKKLADENENLIERLTKIEKKVPERIGARLTQIEESVAEAVDSGIQGGLGNNDNGLSKPQTRKVAVEVVTKALDDHKLDLDDTIRELERKIVTDSKKLVRDLETRMRRELGGSPTSGVSGTGAGTGSLAGREDVKKHAEEVKSALRSELDEVEVGEVGKRMGFIMGFCF